MRTRWGMVLTTGLVMVAAACTDSEDPAGLEDEEVATLTVDAAEEWAFVAFDGEAAGLVTVADASASEEWELGFYATSVMLNGGAAGPAGVVGHCLCLNASLSDAELMDLTADAELSAFEAVTAADVPSDEESWQSDALAPAIDGWYSYDMSTHTVSAAPENVWKVRTASGEAYAKFRVIELENSAQTNAGEVTIEFAVQESAGADFGPTQTVVVDVSAGAVHFDLETASEVTAADEWDLWFEGYAIRVNGGVSGSGAAGASLASESFEEIGDASDLSSRHYAGDAFGGVFDANPWYRYNLDGNHQIWPTYDVYLIRRGEAIYKVQLTSYYGSTGDARQITLRYERLQ